MYDEPELVCKEDKQEKKAEVNQNEHITERVNEGDNQKEMAPKNDHGNQNEHITERVNAGDNEKEMAPKDDQFKDTAEEAEELFYICNRE